MLYPLCVLVCAVLVSIELCGVQAMADTQADIQKEDGQCGESLIITVNPTIITVGGINRVYTVHTDIVICVKCFMHTCIVLTIKA